MLTSAATCAWTSETELDREMLENVVAAAISKALQSMLEHSERRNADLQRQLEVLSKRVEAMNATSQGVALTFGG